MPAFSLNSRGIADPIKGQRGRAWTHLLLPLAVMLSLLLSLPVANAGELSDPFLGTSYYEQELIAEENAVATDSGITPVSHVAQGSRIATMHSAVEGYPADASVAGGMMSPGGPAGYASSGVVPVSGYSQSYGGYGWQIMPDGLIYKSYQAGPRESRVALHAIHNSSSRERSQSLWDATLGGRRGIVRHGSTDPLKPSGWQIDIEGATIVRLNIAEDRDVDASDFRFGIPVTWGDEKLQFKSGYYHLSSHLGDELIARSGMNNRINYVRDAFLFGVSYNPTPAWRIYGETAWAFFTAGGAEPWEFQLGAEYSQPGVTSVYGTPFFATNAHLREEIDFGGDWTTQIGWLWRGESGSTTRLGLHYMNGKSTQYQFFNQHEEQIGFGIWYDF